MKKFLIFTLLLPVFFAQAQQLDESFLESLPDDVKEDLMKRSSEQTQATDGALDKQSPSPEVEAGPADRSWPWLNRIRSH